MVLVDITTVETVAITRVTTRVAAAVVAAEEEEAAMEEMVMIATVMVRTFTGNFHLCGEQKVALV